MEGMGKGEFHEKLVDHCEIMLSRGCSYVESN